MWRPAQRRLRRRRRQEYEQEGHDARAPRLGEGAQGAQRQDHLVARRGGPQDQAAGLPAELHVTREHRGSVRAGRDGAGVQAVACVRISPGSGRSIKKRTTMLPNLSLLPLDIGAPKRGAEDDGARAEQAEKRQKVDDNPVDWNRLPDELWQMIVAAIDGDNPCLAVQRLCRTNRQLAEMCRQGGENGLFDAINTRMGWYGVSGTWVALVAGYDFLQLGFMWQPTKRAEMEKDVDNIHRGSITKEDAIRKNIEPMIRAFMKCESNEEDLIRIVKRFVERGRHVNVEEQYGGRERDLFEDEEDLDEDMFNNIL